MAVPAAGFLLSISEILGRNDFQHCSISGERSGEDLHAAGLEARWLSRALGCRRTTPAVPPHLSSPLKLLSTHCVLAHIFLISLICWDLRLQL